MRHPPRESHLKLTAHFARPESRGGAQSYLQTFRTGIISAQALFAPSP